MKSFKQAGFTLIEILIAIAIIGVIAGAAFLALDPLEQIRKSQDTTIRAVATEYLGALQLYYANKGQFPWDVTSSCVRPQIDNAGYISISFSGCTTELINAGFLKSTAANQTVVFGKLGLFLKGSGTEVNPVLCYNPESKSESSNTSTTVYTLNGAACNPATTQCHVCIQ